MGQPTSKIGTIHNIADWIHAVHNNILDHDLTRTEDVAYAGEGLRSLKQAMAAYAENMENLYAEIQDRG